MKIINNTTEKLADDLRVTIKKRSRVSMAAACFSVYAFEELKAQLENLDELRFIFTSPAFLDEKPKKAQREFYIPRLNRERTLHGSEFEIKLRSEFRQRAISQECAHWIREKARFKSNKTMEGMTGFLTVDSDSPVAYAPVNGFTREDLGCDRGGRMFSMINRVDAPESKAYLELFDQLWNDQSHLKDVTDKVLESITTAYQENSPEFLYFYALYNIFGSFLEQVNEDDLPSETNGFKESQVWNKLYTFQKDAVIAIISKLEQYNGCILADSVGLGKTFTALAVIKYYENRNLRVLVLCPKKLSDNWMTYKANYVNNPIAGDRLRYDVLYHTDLSRDKGFSGEIDLSKLNWSAYDLVVIDESHNFRNGGDVDNEGKENRYTRLMNKVIRPGARTRVLMLSATPVNNRFYDLRNQLALAYEGDSYINLKGRVETRMKALVMTSTGDDNLLSPEEQGNLEYRREQLKRLQTEVVDLEEMGTGVSITDLGLNEFRMEVMEYAKRHPELETTPGGISAVTQALPDAPAGVVFVLKNVHNEININDRNRLHPYYLVYLTEEGEIVYDHLSPRSTLETMRQLCHGKTEPIQALCRAFNEETRCGEEMQLYSDLLEEAVLSIVDAKEDSDLDSLFRAGGTTALLNQISGLDDFELICFLVVKEG